MSQILFGQSYFLRFDPKLWEAMQPYPPLGTLYAASYVRQRGYEAALFDAMLSESEEEWAESLDRHRPEFAVLFEDNFNYLSKMCLLRMRQAAHKMIEMAKRRGCCVILCGADASDHAEAYLDRGADFVLIGEGEETLGELLDRLTGKTGAPLGNMVGLAYKDSGQTRRNPRRPDLRDLDRLPFPAWDLVDVERYRSTWLERHGYFSMNLVTTRGCPFHCNWCAKPIWGQRYNSRSPENVAEEIRWLKKTYHPDHLWFADDILGLKPGWLPRFGDLMQVEEARTPFKCLSRVDLLLRPGEVEALRQAGAQIVWVGAESGSQRILDAMEKGTRVEQIYEAARRLRAAGIRTGFFLQFGYTGETLEDIEKTIQMVRDCDPDDIGISVSYPLPGTKFYESVRQQLSEKQNWQDSADLAMLYQGPYPTDFYRQLHGVVHKEFRARKAWQALKDLTGRRAGREWKAGLKYIERLLRNRITLPLARWRMRRLARGREVRGTGGTGGTEGTGGDFEAVAEAFSRTAEKYDAFGEDHPHLERMRGKVYAHLARYLPPGGRILELNAGTGVDAVHLAQQGYFVHATDIAAGMLRRLEDKVERLGLGERITFQECSFTELERVPGPPYDAVFSNLGGLNCIPDLSPVIRELPGLLRPGGVVIWVLMPPICLWELAMLLGGQARFALRRLSRKGTRAHLEGLYFDVHYFSPNQAAAWFGKDYELLSIEGLSVITPTAESKNFARRFPRLYQALSRLDDRLSTRPPWWGWGDFYILSMRRGPNPPGPPSLVGKGGRRRM